MEREYVTKNDFLQLYNDYIWSFVDAYAVQPYDLSTEHLRSWILQECNDLDESLSISEVSWLIEAIQEKVLVWCQRTDV